MKFLMALILVAAGSNAFACKEEAQFMGKIKNHRFVGITQDTNVCTFQIEFSQVDDSLACPSNISGEAAAHTFFDLNCHKRNGEVASGYLSKKHGVVIWERN